jgi:hypothetical protein
MTVKKKYVAVGLRVMYDSPGNQQERGRLDIMLWPKLEASRLHLERARDVKAAQKLVGTPTIGRGWWWRKYIKRASNMGGFPTFWLKNCRKRLFLLKSI